MRHSILIGCSILLVACGRETPTAAQPARAADTSAPAAAQAQQRLTPDDARDFVEQAEREFAEKGEFAARVAWIQANFVTYDTNALLAQVSADQTAMAVRYANEARMFNGMEFEPELRRKLEKLKLRITLPAPTDPAANKSLAEISAELKSMYAIGKAPDGRDLGQLEEVIASSRDPQELLQAWQGWRTISPPMKDKYVEMVSIANRGAQELGYVDVGYMWRSGYDMPPEQFSRVADSLWHQVKPLYDSLHCHVRAELNDYYGDEVVPLDQPIPAHLLGNMWAQSWANIYPLVAPESSAVGYDLTERLKQKGYTEREMVETGEAFFTSLGFEPLPQTFWERSLITKPADRDVQCHASAWNLDSKNDVRIKMCTKINGEDFETVHHELGHNYYQRAYQHHSSLHQSGAHDGFHEAIGDTISLSITPEYLKQIGLIEQVPSADGDIGLLMKRALEKVAFLPFGLLVDKWRWQVFSGELTPATYNQGWWQLREEYQGIRPPLARDENAFDPGAKYHIPGNTPYMRYFLAHILQFQFHKAACDIAGYQGPLHRCTIYGNEEVGTRFNAMLEMGASKPWPQALEAFTGTRAMDASAVLEYFAPLKTWLDEQNRNRTCGWG